MSIVHRAVNPSRQRSTGHCFTFLCSTHLLRLLCSSSGGILLCTFAVAGHFGSWLLLIAADTVNDSYTLSQGVACPAQTIALCHNLVRVHLQVCSWTLACFLIAIFKVFHPCLLAAAGFMHIAGLPASAAAEPVDFTSAAPTDAACTVTVVASAHGEPAAPDASAPTQKASSPAWEGCGSASRKPAVQTSVECSDTLLAAAEKARACNVGVDTADLRVRVLSLRVQASHPLNHHVSLIVLHQSLQLRDGGVTPTPRESTCC